MINESEPTPTESLDTPYGISKKTDLKFYVNGVFKESVPKSAVSDLDSVSRRIASDAGIKNFVMSVDDQPVRRSDVSRVDVGKSERVYIDTYDVAR